MKITFSYIDIRLLSFMFYYTEQNVLILILADKVSYLFQFPDKRYVICYNIS